jgi:ADP-ribose pyrophosphatase YjhB (NUDIX family)
MQSWQNQSVIGVVFSSDRTKVLLVKRRDVPVWTLPGGGIEEGESLKQAICREIQEETNLKTVVVKKIGEYTPINRLARFTHLFECGISSGEISSTEESASVKFFNLETLPKMPPPYKEWIEDSLKSHEGMVKKTLSSVSYYNFCKNVIFHPILIARFLLSRINIHLNSH